MNLSSCQAPAAPCEARAFDAGGDLLLLLPAALNRRWPPFVPEPEPGDRPRYQRQGALGLVEINGPLDQRGSRGYWSYWDGYEAIAARICAALLDPQVGCVVLRINSPGGVVAGCFEAVATILRAKAEAGKPIHVIVDEMACSAAYALACVADRITLPASGELGSVGVVATYYNWLDELKQAGVRVAVLTSGEQKADGSPVVPWDKAMLARLQAEVDELAGLFFALVARARKTTPEAIQALQAATFRGQAAVDAGLADAVQSPAEALDVAAAAALARRGALLTTARAEKDRLTMKSIANLLGLPEDASEEALVAALSKLLGHKASLDELCAVTSKTTAEEALGVARGWAKTAEAYETLVVERAKEQAAARSSAIEDAFLRAKEEGRLTPAQEAAKRQLINSGVLVLDADIKVAAFRAELLASPIVVPGHQELQGSGQTSAVGKRWEDMTTAEKHALYNDVEGGGRAVYDAALADYKARTHKRRLQGTRQVPSSGASQATPTSAPKPPAGSANDAR